MNGLLLVNKPTGCSSFDLIRQLRRITGIKKIGHAGTLDPLASGLMLLLIGSACKQAQQFSKLDKTYLAEITLGANSTTGDNEGDKVAVSDREPTLVEITEATARFIGEITQTPSQYSAIKINGTEAYKLARAGKSVDMPSRQVTVHDLRILSYSYPLIKIETSVSSGTYIRSLAEDIGASLEVGGYISKLERTHVDQYDLANAISLEGATSVDIEQRVLTI